MSGKTNVTKSGGSSDNNTDRKSPKEDHEAPPSPSSPEAQVEKMWWPLRLWCKTLNYLSSSLPGGPKCIKMAYVVNFQKCATVLVCAAMLKRSQNMSPTATMYTALHGGYGLCWLLKELVFPDPKWQQKITPTSAVAIFGAVLGPYWLMAYNAILRRDALGRFAHRSNVALAGAAIVCLLGLTLMVGADAQKYFVLQRQKGLITDGFFGRVRHPNYLGEMMIYGSFAFVSAHWSSWTVVGYVWTTVFVPWMLQKEARMSRHPEWVAYKARSGFLIPVPRCCGSRGKTTTAKME